MAEPFRFLDAYGRPLQRAALTQERAVPTVTGIRHHFDDSVASGLTSVQTAMTAVDPCPACGDASEAPPAMTKGEVLL